MQLILLKYLASVILTIAKKYKRYRALFQPYNGTDYAYVFDNNRYLLTGNFSFNGKTYQTFASGQLEGAVIGVK